MEEGTAPKPPLRQAVRWGILFAAVLAVGWHVPKLVREYHAWREAIGFDPSAADAWRTFFMVDLAGILIVAVLAGGVFYLLRPRKKRAA